MNREIARFIDNVEQDCIVRHGRVYDTFGNMIAQSDNNEKEYV